MMDQLLDTTGRRLSATVGGRAIRCALAAALLASCASAPPPPEPPESAELPKRVGAYKVGSPYRINGVWYYPQADLSYDQVGIASWYGPGFHGRTTANGEVFDQTAMTAAHPTLQMPSYVLVTNLDNGRAQVLRINDRGPFIHGRIIDVSRRAARALGFERRGTARVRVTVLKRESELAAAEARRESDGPTPDMLKRAQDITLAELGPLNRRDEPAGRRDEPAGVTVTDARTTPQATPPARHRRRLFVQVGSFSVVENATRLRRRLEDTIGPTRVDRAAVGDRSYYRVRLGPIDSARRAESLRLRLVEAGNTDARVVLE